MRQSNNKKSTVGASIKLIVDHKISPMRGGAGGSESEIGPILKVIAGAISVGVFIGIFAGWCIWGA